MFLRGKVAYLFERYNVEQELTGMLLCIETSNQEVRTLPAMVKARDVAEFIRTVVTDLQQEGGETRKGRRLSEEIVAKTVCRHAVKANDALKPAEWDMLLHDLLACDLPYTCPHGRPTMIQLSLAELDKKFGRSQ